MKTLVRIELLKVFRKWRSYIGFLAIAVLIPVIQLAIYLTGDSYMDFALQNLKQSFEFVGSLLNGYLIAHFIMQLLIIHIPFLIVLVGGDLLAGEATASTYRLLLTRPVARIQIVNSKFIAGFIYTNMLLGFLMIMSLFVSVLIFGSGELLVIKTKIYIFAPDDVLWRFFAAYGFAVLSMSVVLSLSVLFSSLVENAIGPIVATMAVIIIMLVISAINVDILRQIRPYLFVTYMNNWMMFFSDPVDTISILNSTLILLLHIFGFYGITASIFIRKDILS
jgi:ABC-2 type transport system permease protein